MCKAIGIVVVALAAACGTEPISPDPAVGTYRIASVNQSRMEPPFVVHIESSRTAIRNLTEVVTDTLLIRADGTWEERSNWRYTDYEVPSESVSSIAGSSGGTYARDEQGRLILTSAPTGTSSSGFLATVGLPATATVTADTVFVPGDLSSLAWQPRFVRIP